jgi:hypothetical protein
MMIIPSRVVKDNNSGPSPRGGLKASKNLRKCMGLCLNKRSNFLALEITSYLCYGLNLLFPLIQFLNILKKYKTILFILFH